MLKWDRTFPSEYDIEVIEELPSREILHRYYFPDPQAADLGGRDGLLLKITPTAPNSPPWIGVFAFGLLSPKGLNIVLSCPNPRWLCVVARGEGYFVNADEPLQYQAVQAEPVFSAYAVLRHNLLVFSDYLHLVAYGPKGLIWETPRISWDGLRVEEIDENQIRGKAWSSPKRQYVDFAVDLESGVHTGGASPDL